MDQTQHGIVTLMRSAVTQERLALPERFDIEKAYPLIQRHHIETLCYVGAVRCGVDREHPVMKKLFQRYVQILRFSELQTVELRRVLTAFDENGIDYMPLKGVNMKALYPSPELRPMSDADILIRMEQYRQIIPIMKSLGFSNVLQSDHELIWESPNLYLELHKRLIPRPNSDFYAYYGDGWQYASQKMGTHYTMTHEDEFVFLFTHFAKHYRGGGIGCRHVLDLWVYLCTYPDLDEAYVRAELEELYLLEFYRNIRNLLAVWFEDAATNEKMDYIAEYIFASGSFGQMKDMVLSLAIRNAKQKKQSSHERLSFTFSHLFPHISQIRNQYPFLEKLPFLLPAVWIIRPFRKILTDRQALKRTVKVAKMLSREEIDTRYRMLQYVGLDYHF